MPVLVNNILLIVFLLLVVGGTWGIDHYGRAYGYREDYVYRIGASIFFIIGMPVVILLAYLQYEIIRTTVFEQTFEGSNGMVPGASIARSAQFMLSNETEHNLEIWPLRDFDTNAHAPANLHVSLADSHGNTILDKDIAINLNEITTVTDGHTTTSYEWITWKHSFTPEVAGQHWLELSIHTTNIPDIYIRVANPSL